jgi:hypothetical protein
VISRPGRHVVRGKQLDVAKYFEKSRSMRIFSFLLYTKKSTVVFLDSKFLHRHQLK